MVTNTVVPGVDTILAGILCILSCIAGYWSCLAVMPEMHLNPLMLAVGISIVATVIYGIGHEMPSTGKGVVGIFAGCCFSTLIGCLIWAATYN